MTSNTIRFVWENKIHSISNLDPNETILNYVRLKLKKTGTKEGCAEGGCGACTIVLGELKNNKIIYKAINSCIAFLPSLEGKQLILVEDLVSKNGTLHTVQDAMINYHGSQCGFCTPGFVMSLFAMYKNFSSYSKENIQDSISGNLCRCTGYRPILDAGKSLNNINRSDQFDKNKKKIINLLKKINSENISLKNGKKKYFSPKSINELIKNIKENPNSIFLSGGTDLSLNVTKERKDINNIISLNSVKELKFIKKKISNIEVGAASSLIDFESFIK